MLDIWLQQMRGKRKYDSLQGFSDKILLFFFLLDTGMGKSRVTAKNINQLTIYMCSLLSTDDAMQ